MDPELKEIRHVVWLIYFALLMTYMQSMTIVYLKNISNKSTLKNRAEERKCFN